MSPVGWGGQHLSSGPLLSGSGGARLGTPSPWRERRTPGPMLLVLQPASLARRPLPAKHMASLFSFFTGNRDGGGINCFYLFLSQRLDARRKVQK